jgi:hypothetical protein
MIQKDISGNPTKINVRAYVYFHQVPNASPDYTVSNGVRFLQVWGNQATGQPLASFGIANDSGAPHWIALVYSTATGTVVGKQSTQIPVADTKWYEIEIEVQSGVNGYIKAYVDGVQVASGVGDTTGRGAAITAVAIGMNSYGVQPAFTTYFDELAIGDSYIGPVPQVPTYTLILAHSPNGTYDVASGYTGEGTWLVPTTPATRIYFHVIPNAGYQFDHFTYEYDPNNDGIFNAPVIFDPRVNPDGFTNTTPNIIYRITPFFALTVQHMVSYSSTPIAVVGTVGGLPLASGQSAQVSDGTTIDIVVPNQVQV